jgi:hypothetical protein
MNHITSRIMAWTDLAMNKTFSHHDYHNDLAESDSRVEHLTVSNPMWNAVL